MNKTFFIALFLLIVQQVSAQEDLLEPETGHLAFLMLSKGLIDGTQTEIPTKSVMKISSVYKSEKKVHVPGTTEIYEMGANFTNKLVEMRIIFNQSKKPDTSKTLLLAQYYMYHSHSSYIEDSISESLSGDAYEDFFAAEIDSNAYTENDPTYAVCLFKARKHNTWYLCSSTTTLKIKARLNPFEYRKAILAGNKMDEFKQEEVIDIPELIRYSLYYDFWDLIER